MLFEKFLHTIFKYATCAFKVVKGSMAPARFDNHISILFEDDIGVVVKVENHNRRQFGGCTAWFRNLIWIHEVNQRLYNGMIGGVHMWRKRERALSMAKEGSITIWCNDPILPA